MPSTTLRPSRGSQATSTCSRSRSRTSPSPVLETVRDRVPIFPPPAAIAAAQDRLSEKQLFGALGIPTAPFVAVAAEQDLHEASRTLGWPIVLKSRRLGYDGRGQRIADSLAGLIAGWDELKRVAAIAEGWVAFERELSLIGVCGAAQRVFYPLAENVHRNGILSSTVAPYADHALQRQAETWLAAIMQKLEYRGVLTVEFFHTRAGLVANEMAPRVHNSGHWTIEGAQVSQFENHLRAVLGWPLGDPSPRGHAAMLNLIGTQPRREAILAAPGRAPARLWENSQTRAQARPLHPRRRGPRAAVGTAHRVAGGSRTGSLTSKDSSRCIRLRCRFSGDPICTASSFNSPSHRSVCRRIRSFCLRASSTREPRRTWSRPSGSRTASW